MEKLIITVALTGNVPTKKMNPHVPLTPDEIAADVRRCADAGAVLFHVHARDAQQHPTLDPFFYKENVLKIKEVAPEVIVQLSTGGRAGKDWEARVNPIRLLPEMGSFTTGSNNLPGIVYENSPQFIEYLARIFQETDVKPEIEVFETGMINNAMYLKNKGLIHPPNRFIAYVRYIQDPKGDRQRKNILYKKVYPLSEREKLLENKYSQYLYYDPIFGERLEGVPIKCISTLYQPSKKVSELLKNPTSDKVEKKAIKFVQYLHDTSKVPMKKLGLSGSILLGLYTKKSDIDLTVYGRKNCLAMHETLKQLMKEEKSNVSSYNLNDLKRLYNFRSRDTHMPLEDFLRIERRKSLQGKYENKDFFIRFLIDWDEVNEKYGDRRYVPMGNARIKAKIVDASNSIFTPCSYQISNSEILEGKKSQLIKEIVSFRGRFCEQAVEGETIIAQGKVEKTIEKDKKQHLRLILGAKVSDYMLIKHAKNLSQPLEKRPKTKSRHIKI